MSSLAGLFKAAPEEAQDNEKLVDLFRNRAELKKEFATLREEKYGLQDRIKQHEGATARVQQKMDHLESLLLDREWVHNVVAFYQLRRLSAHCNAKLARFAEQLKQQHEQRNLDKAVGEWNAERGQRSTELQARIGELRLQTQLLEDQLQSERHRLMTMSGFSKLFRGKRLTADIAEIESGIESGQAKEREYLSVLASIQTLNPPDQEGLGVATKRSINFMIISFSQQLYLHFVDDNLASMAKEASEKSVGAINYGSKFECDEIIELIEGRWDSMESVADCAELLQKRAAMIAEHAMFRNDDDVIPVPGTVATVYSIDPNGVVKRRDASLLGDNYFGITKVLSR